MAEDFTAAAKGLVLAAIDYLEKCSACPFCELGHTVPDDVIRTHDGACPLRGYEATASVEALKAWATAEAPPVEPGAKR